MTQKQIAGLTAMLMAILMSVAYEDSAFFDTAIHWHDLYALLGLAGALTMFFCGKKNQE